MVEELDNKTLNLLEDRVSKLETKVFGAEGPSDEYNLENDALSVLANIGAKLGNALSTRDRMMMVVKRIKELERYLDPSYAAGSQLSDNVKADLIIAEEDRLRTYYDQLGMVNNLKQYLNSQHIMDTAHLNGGLTEVWNKHYTINAESSQQTEEVTELLQNYNSIIKAITESFVRMDEIVTRAEIASKPNKISD